MLAAARLPHAWQLALGRRLGPILALIKRKELRVANRNLELCFPEWSAAEREQLIRRHFETLGIAFFEISTAWFAPIERLREIVEVRGREHLDQAIASGQGVILLAAHFTTLETSVAMLEELCSVASCMYRPQRNPMIDTIVKRGRSRFAQQQISRDDVRGLIKALRKKSAVVYLPDQTYLGNQSALVPFFGEPAVTNIATSKLAKIGGAVVIPYFSRRLPDDSSYVIDIGPPLANIPSDDAMKDTGEIVNALENYIRQAPEQYLWLYKKFKGRPAPCPNAYEN